MNPTLVSTRGTRELDEGPTLEQLDEAGVQVELFRRIGPGGSLAAWGVSLSIVPWFAANIRRFDVVNLQYVWSMTTFVGALIAQWRGVPVVLTPHESLTTYDIEKASRSWPRKTLKRILRPLILRMVDALVLMSPLEVRDTDNRGVQVFLVPHAVELPRIASTASPERDRSRGGELRIGFIGRNIPKKGIDRLIRGVGLSGEENWTISIAGPPADDELQTEYRRLSEDLRIAERIRWLGFVEDRDSFLSSLDVLVMPSEYEGFGMAAAEAMAAGVPAIVPRESGISDLIDRHGGGIVVDRPKPDQILAALRSLTLDPETLDRVGREARQAIEIEHSLGTFASRMERIYSVVGGARPDSG